ncbi:chaperonin 10-like protein [Aspergillus carlsbadensis]|nr:chaperonin 10-like protein [Aspergillus carlsbadensis]
MAPTQTAVYVDANTKFAVRTDIPIPEPAQSELLIDVHYTGVNPADVRHATGLGIKSTVLGYDFAGRVVKAPAHSRFREGAIVAGYTPSGIPRPEKYGTYQPQLAVPDDMVFNVPANLPESHAAALTVVVMTAADALYNLFGFPLPTQPGTFDNPILIWGASSGVGISAVQFARASEYRNIITTSSSGRFNLLRKLGACHVFDYSSPTVVADVRAKVEEIGQGPITHALDAVGTIVCPMSSDQVYKIVDENAKLACVTMALWRRFQMPVATTNSDFQIQPFGAPQPIAIPARPKDHLHAWKALEWAIDNYGTAFELPSVHVLEVTAEEALVEANKVATGSRGFGKVVFRLPFK